MADACHFENVYVIWYISGNKTTNINAKKTVVYLQLIPATYDTSKTAKMMNVDITLEARWHLWSIALAALCGIVLPTFCGL